MIFLPTWSARNDVERKGFSSRIKSYYENHAKLENPNYYFLDDKGKLIKSGFEIIEGCKAHDLTLGMGHVSWQESLAFIEAARDMAYSHRRSQSCAKPHDRHAGRCDEARRRDGRLSRSMLERAGARPNGLTGASRPVSPSRSAQIIASTDYFRPYSPNPAELFRMYFGMLEGGLSRGEVNQVASINPARLMGME